MESRGTIEWDGRRVTIEGPAEFVSAELARFRDAALAVSAAAPVEAKTQGNDRRTTDAGFVAEKLPNDHMEKIAVLAVRLKEAGKEEFNGDDMRRAYLRAGIKPPKAMGQALVDTKRHRDFIEPTATRGSYRLTHHGEDFVGFELPRKAGGSK